MGNLDGNGYNYPGIADMDGDGQPEVVVGSAILDGATGAIRGKGPHGIGAGEYYMGGGSSYGAMSIPIDLNVDGKLELITENAAYTVNGDTIWHNGGQDGLVSVADFDGDGEGEIVVSGGARVWGLETNGTQIWEVSFEGGSYLSIGSTAVDDIDGDGEPEIVFAAQNYLYAYEWGGELIWQTPISDTSGAAGPTLFDFEMDGYPEVLYADENTIRFFNGLDGSVKFESDSHTSVTILETPIVVDVDGDDQVEIVVGHCSWSGTHTGVTVYGDADQSWPPGRKIWNQHAYNITNVDALGTIPTATPPNWPQYNSFRSGDVGLSPSEYYDLMADILDVCEDECDDGVLYVAARIPNAGNVDAPVGVSLSLRAGAGGPILASEELTEIIPSGSTGEMVVFEVDAADMSGAVPVVTADENFVGSGMLYECEEANNVAAHDKAVCDLRRWSRGIHDRCHGMILAWVLACQTGTGDDTAVDAELRFAFPILEFEQISDVVIAMDHDPVDYGGGPDAVNCLNYAGETFPNCYDEHDGTDFMLIGGFDAMDSGSATVIAAAAGTVVEIEDGNYDRCHLDVLSFDATCDGYDIKSNFVGVKHEGGVTSWYYHLKKFSLMVEVGDFVEQGQSLALIGSSGRSSGPHLHFEPRNMMGDEFDPFAGDVTTQSGWWCDQGLLQGLPGDCE